MLGPWIQKTRMGILRTIMNLGDSWIQLPFTVYARLFFHITSAVSRQQELSADALAARVAGTQALADGLRQIHKAAAAFGPFLQSEYLPAVSSRVRPPLGLGFRRFLLHKQVAAGTECALQEELAVAKVDPYDSHPPLRERLAALARFAHTTNYGDSRIAIDLLRGVPELERDLLGISVDPELNKARPVEWNEVPELVWLPGWRKEVTRQARALQGATVADAASLCHEPQAIARKLVFPPDDLPDLEQRCSAARSVIGVALGVALVDSGWRMEGDLGVAITCTCGTEVIEPLAISAKIESGELTPQTWRDYCDRSGISALPLAPMLTGQAESTGADDPSEILLCGRCKIEVTPTGLGLCPICGQRL